MDCPRHLQQSILFGDQNQSRSHPMRRHRDNTHHHVQRDAAYVTRLLHLQQPPLIGPHLQSSDKIQHFLL